MAEKPVRVHDFKPKEHAFREVDSSKFLGPKDVAANRWLSERQRIQEAQMRNSCLFFEAYDDKAKTFRFRERQKDREIQPRMKFKTNDALEKLQETVTSNTIYDEDALLRPASLAKALPRLTQARLSLPSLK